MKHPDHPFAVYINTEEYQCPEFDVNVSGELVSCKVPAFDGLHWQFELHGQTFEAPDHLNAVQEYVVEIWVDFKLADIIPFVRGINQTYYYGLYPTLPDPNIRMKMVPSLTELRVEVRVFEVSSAANILITHFQFSLCEPVLASMANCPLRGLLPFYRRRDQLRPGALGRDDFAGVVSTPYQSWGHPLSNIEYPPSFFPDQAQSAVNMELTDGGPEEEDSEPGAIGLTLDSLRTDRFLLG